MSKSQAKVTVAKVYYFTSYLQTNKEFKLQARVFETIREQIILLWTHNCILWSRSLNMLWTYLICMLILVNIFMETIFKLHSL